MAVPLLPAIIQDLPDALLSDAKHLSQRRDCLASLVTGSDFSIARAFGRSTIGDRRLRKSQAAIRDGNREYHREQNLGE
jgi:hypothetical protein